MDGDGDAPGGTAPARAAFLVGVPRSGTTLLLRLLDGHPDLLVLPHESHAADWHGAPDPARRSNLYLLANDTDVDRFAATAFPMWDFKTAAVRQIRAERVVVLADACRSAGVAIAEGAGNAIGSAFGEVFAGARRLTLAASGADEVSVEGAQWGGGHGVFTHYLLEGLGGAADIDGDGVVKFSEVARYVSARVPAETGDRQHPHRAGAGDLALGRADPAGS